MVEENISTELNRQISVLEQNFFQELRKIAKQRLKLEQSSLSHYRAESFKRDNTEKVKEKSTIPKNFSVRLDSSLGVKLAKSRGKSDELEDKLQKTRMAFEDKLLTVDRMKKELDRRENVLIQSIQEIETYLRAIFYLKQEADNMYKQLKKTSKEQKVALRELQNDYNICKSRKEKIGRTIAAFQSPKQCMKNIASDLPSYSTIDDLIEHYLVLLTIHNDLLDHEAECTKVENRLASERLEMTEFKKRIPMIIVSKENELLGLNSTLRNIRGETAQLEEQIDITIFSKVKDDAVWYDIQWWIKKLFLATAEIRPPGAEDSVAGTINMLDRIKDFLVDGLEMVESLKKEE